MAHMGAAACCAATMYILEQCDEPDIESQIISLPPSSTHEPGGGTATKDINASPSNVGDINVVGHGKRATSPVRRSRQGILNKRRQRNGSSPLILSKTLNHRMQHGLNLSPSVDFTGANEDKLQEKNETMIVKGGAGGLEEVEMDYAVSYDDYAPNSPMLDIPPALRSGYVDGIFATGKVRDIFPSSACYIIKFSPDTSLLAVGLTQGKGLALYETEHFM
eukprot:14880079-Ditylum_brightwellii.AAC.1